MKKGLFFTLLGVTNIGKTTQQELLESHLRADGYSVAHVKYPKYDCEPTGPRLNAFLRKGNPEELTPLEFQVLNFQNRMDFQPTLEKMLEENDVVIAEMYTATSIAYSMGDGIEKQKIIDLNAPLLEADYAILLDGKRFVESKEEGHVYENNDPKTEKIREAHLELAKDFDWDIVNANQTIDEVHEEIYEKVKKRLKP